MRSGYRRSMAESHGSTHTTSTRHIALGDRVDLPARNHINCGVIRFIGFTKFAPGEWCGIGRCTTRSAAGACVLAFLAVAVCGVVLLALRPCLCRLCAMCVCVCVCTVCVHCVCALCVCGEHHGQTNQHRMAHAGAHALLQSWTMHGERTTAPSKAPPTSSAPRATVCSCGASSVVATPTGGTRLPITAQPCRRLPPHDLHQQHQQHQQQQYHHHCHQPWQQPQCRRARCLPMHWRYRRTPWMAWVAAERR